MHLIDLSHNLDADTQIYPGDPAFACCPALTLANNDGCNVLSLSLGTHTGTHVDAPVHTIPDGKSITNLDLSLFHGRALVMDLRGKEPRTKITWDDLKSYSSRMKNGVIAVLWTGWDAHWQSSSYFNHPFLDTSAAEGLVRAGIRSVAMDCLSPDETHVQGDTYEGGLPAHDILLGAGGVIVENLRNVEAIARGDFVMSFMPLKLTDADGSPVRAVAWPVNSIQ